MTDLAALHDAALKDDDLAAASQHFWQPLRGPEIALGKMKWSHLVNTLRFVRRHLVSAREHHERAFDFAQEKTLSSFSGYEEDIYRHSANLHMLILEVQRRLRDALSKGKPLAQDDTRALTSDDLNAPYPRDVEIGLAEMNREPDPAPVRHPQDEHIPF